MSHAFRCLRFYLSPSTAKPRFFLSSTSVRRPPTAPPPPPPPPPHSVSRASTVSAVFLRRLQFPLSLPLLRIHLLRRTSTAPPPTPLQHPFSVTAAWRAAARVCAVFAVTTVTAVFLHRLRFYLSPSTAKPRFFLSSTSVRRPPTAPPPPPPPPPHSVSRASTVSAVFLRRLQFPLSPPSSHPPPPSYVDRAAADASPASFLRLSNSIETELLGRD